MSMKVTMAEFVGLEPCPMCGADAQTWNTPHVGGFHDCAVLDAFGVAVECSKCGLTTRGHFSEEQAIEAWNRRAAVTDHDFAMAVHDGNLWGKCSECEEHQGHYLDAETIQRQQEHIAELQAERDEWQARCFEEAGLHASHVFQRDELIRDMRTCHLIRESCDQCPIRPCGIGERISELGIEVDE